MNLQWTWIHWPITIKYCYFIWNKKITPECTTKAFISWEMVAIYVVTQCIPIQMTLLLSLFSRHIPATCSLLKVGRIIDYGFLTTWLRSTDYYPSNGWQRFGGRIPFSKMQKALPFKRWLFLITTFGFGKTKPSSTWSSKHSFNVSISMNHNGWLVIEAYGNSILCLLIPFW